ncbi:GtrA-like protein [Legionella birminghamensis]|uniref:GtrA-like protein n=1 Tax=Legionella birminghamensis TaxID=28083 RepID=A0A378I501_9GAMM|nr:GtrA family protein [Legionella birminghamensis]KTC68737.1 GtrA-like protein [Legionella birminghamensis]STX30277.1 GtrA-like protein [Legionella birminghamensis]
MVINFRGVDFLRMGRFVAGGGLSTGFTYVVYLLLSNWVNYQLAYGVAYFLGVLFAYWFNTIIVFRKLLSFKGLFTYPLIYLFQYAVSALSLGLVVEKLGISPSIAPLLVIAATLPITYFMNKLVLEWSSPNKK